MILPTLHLLSLNRFLLRKHSDNLENLVIASLSLGAPRTLVLHPRMPHKTKTSQKVDEQGGEALLTKREIRKLPLPNGSLFVMQGRTQEYWKVRQSSPVSARLSQRTFVDWNGSTRSPRRPKSKRVGYHSRSGSSSTSQRRSRP